MKHLTLLFFLILTFTFLNAQEKGNSRVSLKLGYSIVQHLESEIYGQSTTYLDPSGDYSSNLIGLRSMNGLDLKGYYFLKNNIGVYVNLGFGISNNFVDFQNPDEPYHSYETYSDYHSESFGIAARLSPENMPVNFIMGIHAGHFGYSYNYTIMVDQNGFWYDGSYSTLKIGLEASMDLSIYKGLNLFSELSYGIQPWVSGDNFELSYQDGTGNYYSMVFNRPSMASLRFSIGLAYNF